MLPHLSKRALLLGATAFMIGTPCMAVLTVEIGIYSPPHCSYSDGRLYAMPQGGWPCNDCGQPYQVLWSTGDTTGMLYNVAAGTYSVIITDDSMNVAYDTLVVAAEDFTPYVHWVPLCPDTALGPMFEGFIRGSYGTLWVDQMVGPGPHNLSGGFTEVLYTDTFNIGGWDSAYHILPPATWGPPGSGGVINYTDVNGCAGQITWTVPQPIVYDPVQILQADGACTGGSNGHLRTQTTPGPYSSAGDDIHELRRVDGSPFPSLFEWLVIGGDIQRLYYQLPAGDYAFVQRFGAGAITSAPWFDFLEPWFGGEACYDSTFVTIPDNGATCGTLKGKVFVDSDEDCYPLYSEAAIPAMVMEIQPGNHYTITGSQGNYSINLPVGSGYTVTQQTTQYDEHCFGGMAFNITPGSSVTRDQADTSLTDLDAMIGMGSGPKRPGFQVYYGIDFHNLTPTNTGPSTVTVVLDPVLAFVYANPAPASIVGNTLTWTYTNINGFAFGSIDLWGQLPPDPLLIGDTLTTTVTLTTTTADLDLSNNTFIDQGIITGSFDPNDKSVSPGDQFTIDEDSTLTYTIRFQNTGTDTAFLVVVLDTLPAEVDPGTFEMLAASHNYTVTMQGQGVLRWMFPFILLPDSNTNEPMSHGFVRFRVRPRLPLLPGTAISNAADIYFDFNPPIRTNDAVVVAENSTQVREQVQGRLQVFPNPATDMLTVIGAAGRLGRLELFNGVGQRCAAWYTGGTRALLDLSSLPAGAYLLTARSEDGPVQRTRLVLH